MIWQTAVIVFQQREMHLFPLTVLFLKDQKMYLSSPTASTINQHTHSHLHPSVNPGQPQGTTKITSQPIHVSKLEEFVILFYLYDLPPDRIGQ